MISYNLLGEMEGRFVLCEDRHDDAPVKESIFPNTIAVMAFGKLELEATNKLQPLVEQGLKRLIIYTSGCQSALVSVLNVAWKLRIREVQVMHHDTVMGGWQAQHITTLNDLS